MRNLFDRFIALGGLIVLSPLFAILTVLIKIKMGGPVLFRQTRPGLKGQPFEMIKFRTMIAQEGLPDHARLTSFGKFMRATSLDELPELWNVLKGDMNLVGPRPLLMEYLPHYNQEQMRRHDVRPGITGWAQVNGRNSVTWEEKFAMDVWYVDHHSFLLDLKIIYMTFSKVFRREGVNHSQDVTMTKFEGTKKKDVA